MYNGYYSPQARLENINSQIAELERIKSQLPQQQPTNLTQNFQLAPMNSQMKFANSIDDVRKELVVTDTPYFSNDLTVLWIKNARGDIKTFEMNEIVPKDEKDMKIEMLISEIEELKKGMSKYEHNANVDESVEDEKSSNVSAVSKSKTRTK